MRLKQIFALLITILFLVLIFYKIDTHTLVQTFKEFDLTKLWLIVILYTLALYIRGFRWKPILLNNPKYFNIELAENFIVGCFLNIFLPARGGDFYRAFKLSKDKEERKLKILGSIILERTYDGICVFFILLFAVLSYCKQEWILNLTYTVGALFIGSMLIFYFIYRFDKINTISKWIIKGVSILPSKISNHLVIVIQKITNHINTFVKGFESLGSLALTSRAFTITCISWTFEAVVVYLIINSFNVELGFSSALFVVSLVAFSSMIPSTSVYLGPYQYAYILALGIFGIDKSTTLAIATVHQTIIMLILAILTSIYYFRDQFFIRSEKTLQ